MKKYRILTLFLITILLITSMFTNVFAAEENVYPQWQTIDGITTVNWYAEQTQVDKIVAFAKSKIGSTEYVGLCQAFVYQCYKAAGIDNGSAPSAIAAWNKWGVSTSRTNIPVGACVYFDENVGSQYGHVGIYIGNNKMIHSRQSVGKVVESSMTWYFENCYLGWGWQGGIKPSSNSSQDSSSDSVNYYYKLTAPDGVQTMRSDYSTTSSKILDIPTPNIVCVTKYSPDNNWGYVSYGGESGWIRLYYVERHFHSYGSWTITQEATCTSAGNKKRTCSCGATENSDILAKGHAWVGAAAAQYCSDCGMSSNCLKGVHDYTSVTTNPTLVSNGYTTFTCKYCGESYRENYTFSDVPNSLWSYNAIEFAVAKGYFSGYQSGKFGPTDNITRQDFVVVLARLAKVDLSKYSGRTGFPDVQADSYYEKAVKWASSNGIVSGYKNGKFGVGDKITREQLVTILYNYAKKMGYDTSVPSNAAAKLNAYKDAGKVTGYAKPAVIWALNKGIISGMTSTTVAPQNSASRGQVATILMNISKKGIMPI